MNTGKGVIISTWNISECVSTQWDMQNGLDEPLFANQFEPLLEEIISRINESKSDVVCFQEFPIVINNKYSIINEIKQKTNLKYCVTLDTCPSFLFYGGRIGIALFSRTRILQTNFSFFKNPNFLKVRLC